jgi:hypothetical protein
MGLSMLRRDINCLHYRHFLRRGMCYASLEECRKNPEQKLRDAMAARIAPHTFGAILMLMHHHSSRPRIASMHALV